jgi:hypothetical protein
LVGDCNHGGGCEAFSSLKASTHHEKIKQTMPLIAHIIRAIASFFHTFVKTLSWLDARFYWAVRGNFATVTIR